MNGHIRGFTVRTLMPLAWRMNSQRAATALKRFSDTEADSAWQYLRAMLVADDVQLKRMLFENVLEELRHSDYFNDVRRGLPAGRTSLPTNERLRLVHTIADLPYFLAYAHECERSIHDQFDAYARACNIKEVSSVFRSIQEDEKEHESQAAQFLVSTTSIKGARWLNLKVKIVRKKEAYLRSSRLVSDITLGVVLRTIFILYGAVFLLFRSRARQRV